MKFKSGFESFKIGKKTVGPGYPCYIIAEAGSNHDRRADRAFKLIDVAAESGADAVKFQLFSAEILYPGGGPIHEAVKKAELPREWVSKLVAHCRRRKIDFLASPFDAEAVDILAKAGVPAFKAASSETTNLPLLRLMAQKKKPVLLSTAMSDLADVHEAVETLEGNGANGIALLQCTAMYPAPPDRVHLRAMETLRHAFQKPVGFSDHTMSIAVPAAAVALGACVIEKHFTISRRLKGPDHGYAMEPAELKQMVEGIRATEQALGSPEKKMLAEEAVYARRDSLWTDADVPAGASVNSANIAVRRPAAGLRPRYRAALEGAKLRRGTKAGQPLTWEMFE